jgi:predicted GNAT family N-acyltransferase
MGRMPEVEIVDRIAPHHLLQLMELYATAWWAQSRQPDDVAQMLAESDVVVGLVRDGRLVGFARVLTDFEYFAMVLDVIVAPRLRGTGLGRVLMDAVVDHERLARVRSLELVCQPEMIPFYAAWGFTDKVGRSLLMRRAHDG